MKIVCIGGGPGGLYFALLMKQRNPAHDITVVERNKPYDTFGWGVVFSDATMDNMRQWDKPTADDIQQAFNHWDDIELLFKGEVIRSGGHGFVGIGRKKLLNILQARCEQLGVKLVFESDVDSDLDFPDADLIIASDGINSKIRTLHADKFQPELAVRPNRFIWLGTKKQYDAFTFIFEKTEHGWFQAHIYKFDDETSTFIVECPEHVWLAHGLDKAGPDESIAFCEKLFASNLQGEKLMSNARHLRGSAWINFTRVKCDQWWLKNENGAHVVLLGDAVHTAHFAIGSGTKLALEDAIDLTHQFIEQGDAPEKIEQVLEKVLAEAPCAEARVTAVVSERSPVAPNIDLSQKGEEWQTIVAVLEEMRPRLQADGGDVTLISVSGNKVEVALSGNCMGCMMTDMTLSWIQQSMMEKLGRNDPCPCGSTRRFKELLSP